MPDAEELRPVTRCPRCGEELSRGWVLAGRGLHWVDDPSARPPSVWSWKRVFRLNAVRFWGGGMSPAAKCRPCRLVIVKVDRDV